ncbi:PEPxxWA-CTERM sorting domain-containing protein [Sphingomonas sp. RS6]
MIRKLICSLLLCLAFPFAAQAQTWTQSGTASDPFYVGIGTSISGLYSIEWTFDRPLSGGLYVNSTIWDPETGGSLNETYYSFNGTSGNVLYTLRRPDNGYATLGWLDFYIYPADDVDYSVTVRRLWAAVPEPANWIMMIGGFALGGAVLRRRRTMATRLA